MTNGVPLTAVISGLQRLVERVGMGEPYTPGLEGVIAGETAICTLDGGLQYRGYAIEDLTRDATFPEVACLLLHGDLPDQEFLADFQSILTESGELPSAVERLVEEIPLHVGLMEFLRTGISVLGNFDPQVDEDHREANLAKSQRLLAQVPLLMAARYRHSRGLPPVSTSPELSYAGHLFSLMTGCEPTAVQERALDVSLILCAEHEFNASTFAARVVGSTQSDLYSAVVAAVGALKGPLHGGADARTLDLLHAVRSAADPDAFVHQLLERRERVIGFGHRVYRSGDPRAAILREHCRKLACEAGTLEMEEAADRVERIVRAETGLLPNIDWPAARLYAYLGLEPDLYGPLFVVGRIAGWGAHVIEQSERNRMIRPRSRYIGPQRRSFVPLSRRA